MWAILGEKWSKNIVICCLAGRRKGLIEGQKTTPFTPLFTHKFRGWWCRNGG